jgi:hypothetical protein
MPSQLLVLPGSKNFTSSLVILMLPPVPLNHYSAMRASGIDRVLFRYSMRFHSGGTRYRGTLKGKPVKVSQQLATRESNALTSLLRVSYDRQYQARPRSFTNPARHRHLALSTRPNFSYELFNRSNFSICHRSWNYRGCWHQTCPPIDPR